MVAQDSWESCWVITIGVLTPFLAAAGIDLVVGHSGGRVLDEGFHHKVLHMVSPHGVGIHEDQLAKPWACDSQINAIAMNLVGWFGRHGRCFWQFIFRNWDGRSKQQIN